MASYYDVRRFNTPYTFQGSDYLTRLLLSNRDPPLLTPLADLNLTDLQGRIYTTIETLS